MEIKTDIARAKLALWGEMVEALEAMVKPTRRRRIDWPFVGFAAFMGGLCLFFVWLGWQFFKWMVRQALIGG